MRKVTLLFLVSAAWLNAPLPASAQGPRSIVDVPFVLGVVSVVASRCGLRDNIWATRLIGVTEVAIQHLDWSAVTPQTGATEDILLDRLAEGQTNAVSTLASDPNACAKLTPDRLAKIDKIVAGTAPVF